MLGHSPAVVQVGGGCDAGEPREEPLFLRLRPAIGYGTGPNGQRVPSVFVRFYILHDDDDRGFEFDNTQALVHDLVNFRDLLRNKGRSQ